MVKEVNPENTSRKQAYKLCIKAPNPMVTFGNFFQDFRCNCSCQDKQKKAYEIQYAYGLLHR